MDYLPPILETVMQKVNAAMEARSTDPFSVLFRHGIFQDVSKEVYKEGLLSVTSADPLVWMVMPYDQQGGVCNCDLIIALPTEAEWDMEQRETNSFYPRLFPVWDEIKKQLSKSKDLDNTRMETITPKERILPYWGGEETGATSANNLFKRNIDALHIKGLELKIRYKKQNC